MSTDVDYKAEPPRPSRMTPEFKKRENNFLNEIMARYFKKPCTDEDCKHITMVFRQKFPNGADVIDGNYDLYYKNNFMGTVKKNFLFGNMQLSFDPSNHYKNAPVRQRS